MALPTNILSLCSGGGGLDLAVRRVVPSARTVCYVEREVTACAVLAAGMEAGTLDRAPVWTDIKTFQGAGWAGFLDGIIGGYPCQPFSVAGRQRGADDPRHLWPHIERIIEEVNPRWCFFENVANHLRLGGREVLGSLQRMGYRTAATLYRAEEVGAPHRRERLFVLAVADSGCARREGTPRSGDDGTRRARERSVEDCRTLDHPDSGGRRGRTDGAECCEETGRRGSQPASGRGAVGDATLDGRSEGRAEHAVWGGRDAAASDGSAVGEWPPGPEDFAGWAAVVAAGRLDLLSATPQPEVRGVADGLARGSGDWLSRSDQLRVLGNGVVPQQVAAALAELQAALGVSL